MAVLLGLMVPLKINPVSHLYSGYLWSISPFKGLLEGIKMMDSDPVYYVKKTKGKGSPLTSTKLVSFLQAVRGAQIGAMKDVKNG